MEKSVHHFTRAVVQDCAALVRSNIKSYKKDIHTSVHNCMCMGVPTQKTQEK